jgi:hypothetical protein
MLRKFPGTLSRRQPEGCSTSYIYTVQKTRGTCFLNVCHAPQNDTAHPGKPTKPVFFTIEVYKRTSMDSRSFSEHKPKCPNWG